MRRSLYLAAVVLVATLAFASVGMAQQNPYCPEGQYPATAPGDPGEGTLQCFPTQERADLYSKYGVGNDSPITAGGAEIVEPGPGYTCPEGFVLTNAGVCAQESPTTPGRILGYGEEEGSAKAQYQEAQMQALPDTGGLPIIPAAAVALTLFSALALGKRR